MTKNSNVLIKPKIAYLLSEFLGIKYEKFEPRNSESDVDNQVVVRDCAVRSFCKLLNKSWTEIYHEYYVIGLSIGEFGNSKKAIETLAIKYGYIVDRRFGSVKTIVGLYIYNNPKGKYLIGINGHIFCVEDKVIYDHFKITRNNDYNDITNLEAILSASIKFVIRKNDDYNPLQYPKEMKFDNNEEYNEMIELNE